MVDVKRHEILGCRFNGTPDEFSSAYLRRFFGLGNYPKGWDPRGGREDDIHACVGMMALHHLGYPIPVDARKFLARGFDVTIDYFCGSWWKANEGAARRMDKTGTPGDLMWCNAFSNGLLLGLLSERWHDVARVCAWVEADLSPEYLGDDMEPRLVHVYKSIAAGLRSEAMPGLDKLEEDVRKCRTLQPKLLFQAWDAARGKDQRTFETAFVKSLEHFSKNYGTGAIAIEWIAPHHSVVGLAARRLGMRMPDLEPRLEAVVITPESLGFENKSV